MSLCFIKFKLPIIWMKFNKTDESPLCLFSTHSPPHRNFLKDCSNKQLCKYISVKEFYRNKSTLHSSDEFLVNVVTIKVNTIINGLVDIKLPFHGGKGIIWKHFKRFYKHLFSIPIKCSSTKLNRKKLYIKKMTGEKENG